jgi:hypothetical protein
VAIVTVTTPPVTVPVCAAAGIMKLPLVMTSYEPRPSPAVLSADITGTGATGGTGNAVPLTPAGVIPVSPEQLPVEVQLAVIAFVSLKFRPAVAPPPKIRLEAASVRFQPDVPVALLTVVLKVKGTVRPGVKGTTLPLFTTGALVVSPNDPAAIVILPPTVDVHTGGHTKDTALAVPARALIAPTARALIKMTFKQSLRKLFFRMYIA